MTGAPTISLCVIARDEERLLPGCLASVDGAVDERVVLDTGSTDGTVEIAIAGGARVEHRPWTNDFSAARNAALSMCSGDWVLVLDADERLAPGAAKAIRAAVAVGGFHCGLLPLHNANAMDARLEDVVAGAARVGEPLMLPRLLKVDDELAWRGAIHESIGAWLTAGRVARKIGAAIVHLGYLPEVQQVKDKDRRNQRLLDKACADDPTDPVKRTYLARELVRSGHSKRALTEITRAWHDLRAAWAGPSPRPEPVSTTNVYAFLLLTLGRADEALAVVTAGEAMAAGHPNLALLRASALDLRPHSTPAELREGIAALERSRAAAGRGWTAELNPGATSWAAANLAGALHLRLGQAVPAVASFRSALDDSPGMVQATLGLAEASVRAGDARSVLSNIDQLLATNTADAWFIAALATHTLGDAGTARRLVTRARGLEWLSKSRTRRALPLLKQLAAL